MRSLVIYETMFGNTRAIAEAIGEGLAGGSDVEVTDVADAGPDVPDDVDLLIVGGPTHTFSMSRAASRREAAGRGGSARDVDRGIREWLEGLSRGEHPQVFAAFDTRVDFPLLPGAASRSATKMARRLGFTIAAPESFLVEGYEGPLVEGERDRARTWGRTLASGRTVH